MMSTPPDRVAVAESLNRDLNRISERCDLWRMRSNATKTKTKIVSGSRTMHSQTPPLPLGGIVLKESVDLDI